MRRLPIGIYEGITPYTVGMSRCGLGSIFEGTKRLRGVPAVTPSSVARTTRKSWKVNPGEVCLIFWNAWGSIVSRASTMTFRTPSCSMKAITCCCAPAPIDSIATTAATPKIIPSIVRSERSLWTRRLSRPNCRSCSHVPNSEFGSGRNRFTVSFPSPASPVRRSDRSFCRPRAGSGVRLRYRQGDRRRRGFRCGPTP